jgi:hypothetical protein
LRFEPHLRRCYVDTPPVARALCAVSRVRNDRHVAAAQLSRHPVVLLILTALLTGLLVPWITSRWERRDKAVEARRAENAKELEVETALVRQIGVSSARFLAAAETADFVNQPRALDSAYRDFEQASFDIGSQLAAYFPSSRLSRTWGDFAYSIRNAYNLLVARPGRARNLWLSRLTGYFHVAPINLDGLCFPAENDFHPRDLRKLVLRFQEREAVVVTSVVGAEFALRTGARPKASRSTALPPLSSNKHPCNRYFKK